MTFFLNFALYFIYDCYMKRLISLLFIIVLFASCSSRKEFSMNYEVRVDTVGHYLDVCMLYEANDIMKNPVLLKMPVWAPGYYLIVDYPKNLTDFQATDTKGAPLKWEKVEKNGWRVYPTSSSFEIRYRVFADARSVAECRVNNEIAFIPTNGVLMYEEGQKEHGVEVSFILPDNWKHVSTGLQALDSSEGKIQKFHANDFDELYDSPVLMGNHYVEKFAFQGKHYELALECPDGLEESTFREDVKKIMASATEMMKDIPYEKYCFILLGAGGGGLEHRNSMACYTSGSFRFESEQSYRAFMNFIAHEYFHLYNVKDIRPIELGPFDYDKEVFTPMLWVAEGFTVYYEGILMRRAGLSSSDDFLAFISDYIKTIESQEGHKRMSLRQSSYDIWLNFFNFGKNGKDVRISYYDKGPILGLLMDIEIRQMTENKQSLDDVMRLLYNRFYKELKRGYTEEEFWNACKEVAGQPLDLMRHYVDTTDEIDYAKCLQYAGLALNRETWQLVRIENVTPLQEAIRKAILSE